MGTEHFASRFDVIDEEFIEAEVSKELREFYKQVDEVVLLSDYVGVDGSAIIEDFAREEMHSDTSYNTVDEPIKMERVAKAYRALQVAFEEKTGLVLHIGYVGDGLRGSDLREEYFWWISNYTIPNPKALEFETKHKTVVAQSWFLDGG